ncbi:MAG: AAA family ATPase, partial [Tannerella sp.]|nr:AAA family ATPase [Tannerella sp.]
MSVEETIAEMKHRYDGYHFSKQTEGLYNPFSLLNCFADKDFGYYWFATGTPTFLVKMLKDIHFDISDLEGNIKISDKLIMDYRYENKNPVPVMYQSGYLTIKSYDKFFD